jgi:ABC-type transporter Mla MlaB component
VGRYLSHRRQVPAERVERCKEALKVVGRINRDSIYDLHQEYPHITVRKHFTDYLAHRSSQLDSSALAFLGRVDPTHAHQPDSLTLRENLSRGGLVV